jgi:hypothetical protein
MAINTSEELTADRTSQPFTNEEDELKKKRVKLRTKTIEMVGKLIRQKKKLVQIKEKHTLQEHKYKML